MGFHLFRKGLTREGVLGGVPRDLFKMPTGCQREEHEEGGLFPMCLGYLGRTFLQW